MFSSLVILTYHLYCSRRLENKNILSNIADTRTELRFFISELKAQKVKITQLLERS